MGWYEGTLLTLIMIFSGLTFFLVMGILYFIIPISDLSRYFKKKVKLKDPRAFDDIIGQ